MAAEPYTMRGGFQAPARPARPLPRYSVEPMEETEIDPDDNRKLGFMRGALAKVQKLFKKHGVRMLKHTVVLSAVAGLVHLILKALDNREISEGLIKTTGKLRAVTELVALAFGVYKLVEALVNAATPADEAWRTPSIRERMRDLDQKNQELLHAATAAHRIAADRERSLQEDPSVHELKRYRDAVRKNEKPVKNAGLPPDNSDSDILDDIETRHNADEFKFDWDELDSGKATGSETLSPAFALVRASVPYAVTGAAILGLRQELVPSQSVRQDQRFLERLMDMDADERRAYALRLSKNHAGAQNFLEVVTSLMRRLHRDPVGNKIIRLGGFVVKWAAIFAVQAVMFSMLKYITKLNAFDIAGSFTRVGLAALCAVNSVLVLLHVAKPDVDEDTGLVRKIGTLALESKKTITTKLLPAA